MSGTLELPAEMRGAAIYQSDCVGVRKYGITMDMDLAREPLSPKATLAGACMAAGMGRDDAMRGALVMEEHAHTAPHAASAIGGDLMALGADMTHAERLGLPGGGIGPKGPDRGRG